MKIRKKMKFQNVVLSLVIGSVNSFTFDANPKMQRPVDDSSVSLIFSNGRFIMYLKLKISNSETLGV